MANKRIKRNSFAGVPTTVKGVRAENSFWEKCDTTAESEGSTRNELIVRVVEKYCEAKENKNIIVGENEEGKIVTLQINYLGE